MLAVACGEAAPVARPRAEQIAQLTQVAATTEARAASQTAQAQRTATAAPINTAATTRPPSPPPPTATAVQPATPRYPPPTVEPSATATVGKVLSDEDLTQPSHGWSGSNWPCDQTSRTTCQDPRGLRLTLPLPGTWRAVPHFTLPPLPDVHVDLDVTVLDSGEPAGAYGVLCRFQDVGNYYVLRVWTDGRYAIYKSVQGLETRLAGSGEGSSSVINQGAATNRVRATCVGTTFTLAVNGQELLRVEDDHPAFHTGGLALYGCTCRGGNIDVLFTHITVSTPATQRVTPAPTTPGARGPATGTLPAAGPSKLRTFAG